MHTQLPAPVRELAETLATCADPPLRTRLLLEGALALGAGRSATLWRRLPGEAGGTGEPSAGAWHAIRAHGPSETQPPAGEVMAALEGRLGRHLPGRHRVLGAWPGSSTALVLGEVSEDEDRIDLAEGLFACWAAADQASTELLEAMNTLLPSAPAEDGEGDRTRAPGETSGAGLTHDLRNLLAGIRSTQEILGGGGAGLAEDERRDFEDTLGRECRRAGELVARLATDLRALEPGAPEHPEPASPSSGCVAAQVVRDVVRSERSGHPEVRVELHEDERASSLGVALGELDLERIVRNLIANAREAVARAGRPRRGVVAVTLGPLASAEPGAPPAARYLRVAVEDDGPGIAPELAGRLLEPGVSGKRDAERGGAPSGLGLATVAELVSRAGGRLAFENLPPGGARFEVWLPER